jgi:hypothetical protein
MPFSRNSAMVKRWICGGRAVKQQIGIGAVAVSEAGR